MQMSEEDSRLRSTLEVSGTFYPGYSVEMEGLHLRNAKALGEIISTHGFPHTGLVGVEGCAAACRIVMHAVSWPDFQRRCLELMQSAMLEGLVPANLVAILEDRILYFEGKLQKFGTNMDWDGSGKFVVTPVADEAGLPQRRAFMGLPPMRVRAAFEAAHSEPPPEDPALRQKEFLAWAKRVGWRG